jgi:hypothetical protein
MVIPLNDPTEETQQTAFRLPRSLLERLDHQVAKMRRKARGVRVTRADAVRVLLVRALDDAERER